MTFQKIASELAKREGKKSQAKIHDVRELLKVLVQWDSEFSPLTIQDAPLTHLERLANREREKREARAAKKAAKAKK
jgi:hypothetical protein